MFNVFKSLKENLIPLIIIITAILIGYSGLFFGADMFIYGDQYVNSNWTYGNNMGNGWRPDLGLGTTFFYCDPGACHPWSILSLWERIISSRKLAYHSSIVMLDILSAFAVYYMLRRTVSKIGIAACFLAPLVIFTTHQSGYHFSRIPISSIVGVSLFLILLFDYYRESKPMHYFCLIFLFWYVIFLGSLLTFTPLLSLGFVFSIIYCRYYKVSWERIFVKYFLIIFTAGTGAILLGFWEFYSIFLEHILTEHLREKIYHYSFWDFPDVKTIISSLLGYIQFYSVPTNIEFLGLGWRPFYYSYNVVSVFPLIFIFFLFRRSVSFWEFAFKWMLVVFYSSQVALAIPFVRSTIGLLGTTSLTMFNFYGTSWSIFIFPLQIVLVGMFLMKIMRNDFEIKQLWGKRIQIGAACLLFMFYAGLAIFSVFALLLPDFMTATVSSLAERLSPEHFGRFSKEFLMYGVVNNILALQSSIHWYSLTFYLLSALSMFVFTRSKRFFPLAKNRAAVISGILLLTAILYSWTVYPLNYKQAVWEEIAPNLPVFAPTDRFYYVKEKSLSQQPMDSDTLEEIKRRVKAAGGVLEFMEKKGDYHESPGLNFHGAKSFDQKNVAEFTYNIFNGDGVKRLNQIRNLYAGGPLIVSELLDMGAVSYYYSAHEIEDKPEQLSLYVKTKLIYIYKNHAAWQYFYLADRLEIKDDGKHLKNVQKGSAYLTENDFFKLSGNAGNSNIQLKEFSYGRMVFDYYGDRDNFLVVADVWHPFWKAKTENQNLSVVKANEIFKGVKIPSGKHTLTLFFDTSPYYLGIYISVIAWILFLSGLIFVLKYKW